MAFYYIGMIIQVGLIVHVIKTGRPWYWLLLLLIFPGIGGLAYFLVEIMPGMRRGGGLDAMTDSLRHMVAPAKKIEDLEEELELSPTQHNRQVLAQAYADAGRYDDAIALLKQCLSGAYKDDPDLLMLLAEIHLKAEQFEQVPDVLAEIERVKPRHKVNLRGLLAARALEGLKETEAALKAYESILPLYSGEEARCRYALLLLEEDREEEAMEVFNHIVRNVKRSPRYYRQRQRHWHGIATKHLK